MVCGSLLLHHSLAWGIACHSWTDPNQGLSISTISRSASSPHPLPMCRRVEALGAPAARHSLEAGVGPDCDLAAAQDVALRGGIDEGGVTGVHRQERGAVVGGAIPHQPSVARVGTAAAQRLGGRGAL